MLAASVAILLVAHCFAMPVGNETMEKESTASQGIQPLPRETTTTELVPIIDETAFCSGFRPGNTPESYQRLVGGVFLDLSCQPPLIWSQDQCACEAQQVEIEDPNCPHHRPYVNDPTMFEVRAHGVWLAAAVACPQGQIWIQERCWCDFDPNAPPQPITDAPGDPVTDRATAATTENAVDPRGESPNFVISKGRITEEEVEPVDNSTNPDYCREFRAGAEPESFQVLSSGHYFNFTCQPPLVWSQEKCSCQARPFTIDDPNCPHHRPHPGDETKYQTRAHGVWLKNPISCPPNQVWNQSNCWCDFPFDNQPIAPGNPAVLEPVSGPCYPIFNATFDYSIKDDSQFEFSVGREPWQAISMAHSVEGSHGGMARVNNGRMPLWFTGGNDFGGKLQIELRFMIIENKDKVDEDIVLLSNPRCSGGVTTISIAFRPRDERYAVYFRDRQISKQILCRHRTGRPYDFHHIDLVYFNDLLTLTVDGVECFGSAEFKSGMMPSSCFIGIGSTNFDGYFDDVVFRRGCLEEERP